MATPFTSRKSHHCYVLEKSVKKPQKKKFRVTNPLRKIGGEDLKLKRNEIKHADILPLFELWKQYFTALSTVKDDRLLKADYHGCILHVTAASNPSQVGLSGIVAHESKHTFQLVTRRDRLVVIPKQGSVFQFVLNGNLYTIYGDNFIATPAGRITKKFKQTLPRLLEENQSIFIAKS